MCPNLLTSRKFGAASPSRVTFLTEIVAACRPFPSRTTRGCRPDMPNCCGGTTRSKSGYLGADLVLLFDLDLGRDLDLDRAVEGDEMVASLHA